MMTPMEKTPLLRASDLTRSPSWQVWRPTSPWFRFYFLVLLSLIPFSGHFVKNQFTALQQLMLDDKAFPISNTMFGALNSAVSIPNMIIPFFGGHCLDARGHLTTLWFLLLMCIGHAIVTIAMTQEIFSLAIFGRVLFGIGEGSVVVGARAMVSFWFDSNELTFAMGVMVAMTSLSKMLAKATVAPFSLYFGSYKYGLIYGLLMCLLSWVIAFVVAKYTQRLKYLRGIYRNYTGPIALDGALNWLNGYLTTRRKFRASSIETAVPALALLQDFSPMFWVLVVLHVVFINVFHLFQSISSSYLYQEHGYSIVDSGYISSLSHSLVLFSPLVGLWIDCVGGRVAVILISAIMGVVAYGLLLFTSINPIVSLLIISLCLASTPAVFMSCVALTIPKHRLGIAFGVVEVIDAFGSTLGNLFVGILRDSTGSYIADMYFFFGLAWILLILCIILAIMNYQNGKMLSEAAQRKLSICDDEEICIDIGDTIFESSDDEV